MSAETITCLNYVVHSLVIGAAAWLLVRLVIRDALQRCILANLAVLMCLYSPFHISMEDLFPPKQENVPVWTQVRETFKADWRVSVLPADVPKVKAAAESRGLDVDEVVRVVRWIEWVVAAVILMRLLVQCVRVQRWAWGLRRVTQEEIEELPDGMHLERVRVFDQEGSPCVAGWFFPVIAVPASAFQKLTPRQWGWLLRHEAEHLRLHDMVVVLLQNCVRAFLWWNPFVHALVEEYARAREEACDAAAVGEQREHTAYADFLLECAAGSVPQRECVMPIAHSRPARRLKARLVALMEARGVRRKLGALFVLGCAAFAILAPVIAASFGIATAKGQEAVKAKDDDGTLYNRGYKVAPDFLNAEAALSDPFAPGKTPVLGARKTARDLLEQKGVSFPPGASAIYNPATSQLIVRNTRSNLALIERGIDALNQRPMMVHFTCKMIQADQFFGAHESILSPAGAEALVRSFSQMKGVDLLTSPSVTTRFDQNAAIEAAREVPPKVLPNGKLSGDVKLVGLHIGLIAKSPVKGKSIIETEASLGVDPDSDALWLPKKANASDWDKVLTHSVGAKKAMASGETLLLHLPTSKRPVTVLITAAALNPSGDSADSFSVTMRVAPPASEGRDLPEKKADKESSEMVTRVYRVAAGFGDGKTPEEYLKGKGVVFMEGTSAQLADGRLTVRNTRANQDLIEAWIESLIDRTQNKSVRVTVEAVEMKGDFLKLVSEWVPPLPVDPKVAETLNPALLEPPPPAEFLRMFVTAGVFTPDQFKAVRKKIADSKAKIETLKQEGEKQAYKLPAAMGGMEAKVESLLGRDGNTIELTVTCDERGTQESGARQISTGISIWGGQTFVLAAQPSEGVSRFLFITGDIEDKAGKK